MTTKQWIKTLKKSLSGIPKNERNRITEFYDEIIHDKTESGMSEEEIVSQLGNPYDVAEKIVRESGRTFKKEEFDDGTFNRETENDFPLWLKGILGFFGVIIALPVIITWGSLIIAFFAVSIAGVACSVGGIISIPLSIIIGASGIVENWLAILGGAITLTGVGLMLSGGFYLLATVMAKLSKTAWTFLSGKRRNLK